MSGSATFTIVTSSRSMNVATQTAPSVHQRWGSGVMLRSELPGALPSNRAVEDRARGGPQVAAQDVGPVALDVLHERDVLVPQPLEGVVRAHVEQEEPRLGGEAVVDGLD